MLLWNIEENFVCSFSSVLLLLVSMKFLLIGKHQNLSYHMEMCGRCQKMSSYVQMRIF